MLEIALFSTSKFSAVPLLYVINYIYNQGKNFETHLVAVDILKPKVVSRWKNGDASLSAFQPFPDKRDWTTPSIREILFSKRHQDNTKALHWAFGVLPPFGPQNKSPSQVRHY